MDEITIDSVLRAGELGCIVEQHGRLYRAEYGLDHRFEAYVAAGVGEAALVAGELAPRFWIVRERERFAGSVAMCHPEQGLARFRWFLLEPHLRGRGLGERLMRATLEHAEQRECARVQLSTFDALEAAAKLYRRHGFVEVERRPGTPWGPPLVEVFYERARQSVMANEFGAA
jgi:GNAT superfamily N-acetyltransferase